MNMVVNISYIYGDKPMRDAMWQTAESNYINRDIEFTDIMFLADSDKIQYSPYLFRDGKKLSSNWDNSKQNILIFDIDDGMSIEEAMNMFSKYEYIIVTTKSHQVEKKGIVCDRYRVILPAINIPTNNEELYFEMLRVLEDKIPMDKQPNCKIGAFIGSKDCMWLYKEGLPFDCKIPVSFAKTNIRNIELDRFMKLDSKVNTNVSDDISEIKSLLNREIVTDILESIGISVGSDFKFKMRDDERTESCKIYDDGSIHDFGSNWDGDIFKYLYETQGMKFNNSIDFVRRFM